MLLLCELPGVQASQYTAVSRSAAVQQVKACTYTSHVETAQTFMICMQDRVEGAELLEAAELRGDDSDAELDDSDAESDSDGSAAESDVELDASEADVDQESVPEAVELSDADSELDDSEAQPHRSDSDAKAESGESDDGQEEEEEQLASDAAAGVASTSGGEAAEEEEVEDARLSSSRSQTARSMSPSQSCSDADNASDGLASSSALLDLEEAEQEEVDSQHEEQEHGQDEGPQGGSRQKHHKAKLQPAADSLQTLKKKLAAVKGAQAQADGDKGETGVPIEWGRVLSAEDFERIKELRHK